MIITTISNEITCRLTYCCKELCALSINWASGGLHSNRTVSSKILSLGAFDGIEFLI